MKGTLLPVLIAVVSLISGSGQADGAPTKPQKLTSQQIFKKYAPFVVKVETKGGSGTGFIDLIGDVYTAYHVLEGATEATITLTSGRKITSRKISAIDKSQDIAVIRTDLDLSWHRPSLADYKSVQIGEPVTVIGNPLGLTLTLTEGIVSSKRNHGGSDYLQLSAPVSPGSSGSPVFNTKGEIVGMVVSTLPGGQQLNFAISCRHLGETRAVPMVTACAKQNSILEKDLTAEGLKRRLDLLKNRAFVYDGTEDVSVLVENLPEALSNAVSASEVTKWVEDALVNAGLRVISDDEEQKRLWGGGATKSDSDELRHEDSHRRRVYVMINALEGPSGATVMNCHVSFDRAGVILPGRIATVTADNAGSLHYFGSVYDKKVMTKSLVLESLEKIIERWKYARNYR